MGSRTAQVTVTVEYEYVSDIEIDEDEYREWLDEDEDTPDAILEFLRSGDELEVIADVADGLTGDVTVSGISEARWAA